MAAEAPISGHRNPALLLAGLTAVALALRLAGINSGLWIDEIFSLVDSFRPPLAEIITTYRHDNHHPFYSVLAHLSLEAFGEAPWTIRLPSVLFGAATIPALYYLGREVAGAREAAFAAALLAVSYHHVWFSQNARGYVIIAWCTVVGTWLLLRLLATGRLAFGAWYAVVVAFGAWTHLTMVFVAVGQAAAIGFHLLRRPPAGGRPLRWTAGLATFALSALLTLALYAPALAELLDHFLNRPSQLEGVSTPGWALLESLRVLALGFGAGTLLLGGVVVAAGAVIALSGLASYARRTPDAFALFVLPGVAILAGAVLARGTMYPRFFFALAGFGILVGVRGVGVVAAALAARLGGTPRLADRLGTWALGALIVLSLGSLTLNYRHPKQDFVGAMAHIDASRRPGDAVAVVGVTDFAYRRYLGRDWLVVEQAEDLARLRRAGPVWFAWTFPRYLAQSAPGLLETLDRDCTVPAVFPGTIGGGDLHVCRLEPAP